MNVSFNDIKAAATYQPKFPPYAHQVEALRRLREALKAGRQYYALLMAMRTGKTKTTLDWFGELVVGRYS